VMIGRAVLYSWPSASGLGNAFYLNSGFFIARYAFDVVLWNLLAAYALWVPRGLDTGVLPGLSWLSAVGLLVLAYTASFAAIDWEEDLKREIPWYLRRLAGGWEVAAWGIAVAGFLIPFWLLLWGPLKRSRPAVIAVGALILLSRIVYTWWLVLPDTPHPAAWW